LTVRNLSETIGSPDETPSPAGIARLRSRVLVSSDNTIAQLNARSALRAPGSAGVKRRVHYMARALVGYVGTNNEQVLALEVGRLRRKVAELEEQLAEARASHPVELDMELHRLAESTEPALT
jgi:hypothetical protein